jgi:hypothetical protein
MQYVTCNTVTCSHKSNIDCYAFVGMPLQALGKLQSCTDNFGLIDSFGPMNFE